MENKVRDILEGLNDEQAQAVRCSEGPVLIVAGAGSGKTRVLTSRIAYILALGCEPSRVLALTFTKKAAGEMKERIAMIVGERNARRVVMGTFHAVFVRFLREYSESLGYPRDFTIYDTSDSVSAIKTCIKELDLDDKIYKPKDVLARISTAKNNLVTVASYRSNQNALVNDAHAKRPRLVDIYDLYQQKLKASAVMDFDDILMNMNILLRDNKEAWTQISDRFSYIMVDEYQDTNFAQYLILRKLAHFHHNICVVGDDSQSIYAFRGAKIENILNFKKDYPECKVFRLERNYRSTGNIVAAANSVIARNEGRIPKECYSVGEDGERLHLVKSYTEQEEAIQIVSLIFDRMRSDHCQYQDFAILYRTNAQSRALEEQLRRRNVPYMIYSGNSFFDRAEVKDMMAYFKLVINPNDDESFKRVVNKPARGIGDTSVSALNETARANGCPLFKAAFMPDAELHGLRSAAAAKIREFCTMIDSLAGAVKTTGAYELAVRIAEQSGLYASYKQDTSIEGLSRTANIEELLNSVQSFIEEREEEMDVEVPQDSYVFTLDDYLENVSLLSNADTASDDEDGSNKVALMTVHSAKGLEFPYVFIAGLEENLFPSANMLSSRSDIEEERRLFYVAVTRAKKAVALSYSFSRMRNGKHENNSPSRFIREIDPQYLDNPLEDDGFEDGDSGDESPLGKVFGSGFDSAANYGRSSTVTYERRGGAGSTGSGRYGGGAGSTGSGRFGGGGSAGSGRYGGAGSTGAVRYGGGAGGTGTGRNPAAGRMYQPRPEIAAQQSAKAFGNRAKPDIIDPDFVAVPMTELRAGERVEHNRFGAGTIIDISGSVPELKARINFDAYGEKLLLLKYAKLRHLKH